MKFKMLIVATTIVANAGFFTNDLKYYQTHLDDAKKKVEECKKAFQHALIDRDKDKIKEIKQDSECIDSKKAIKEAKRREWEAKRALEEKKRKEKEAKNKAIFEKKKKEYIAKYKDMAFLEFIKDGKNDCQYFRRGGMFSGNKYSLKASKCIAWKELLKDKRAKAVKEIESKYPKEKLLDYKNSVCKNAQYGNVKCEFARQVFVTRQKQEVENYFAHKDLLKKDFNECYYKIDQLNKQSKYNEAKKVRKSYKCYMASKGALKFSHYGYFKPMK